MIWTVTKISITSDDIWLYACPRKSCLHFLITSRSQFITKVNPADARAWTMELSTTPSKVAVIASLQIKKSCIIHCTADPRTYTTSWVVWYMMANEDELSHYDCSQTLHASFGKSIKIPTHLSPYKGRGGGGDYFQKWFQSRSVYNVANFHYSLNYPDERWFILPILTTSLLKFRIMYLIHYFLITSVHSMIDTVAWLVIAYSDERWLNY